MSLDQVHYEVFARAKRAPSMTLHFASEDRQKALEVAEELFADGAEEVKVFKETLDQETRVYKTLSIFVKGTAPASEKRKPPPPETPLCVAPGDLYTPHSRERLGRLLDAWLRRRQVTPFELLHRADLVEALDAAGSDLQHAIQKIAVPEAQARGLSTHDAMRAFAKLAERAMERVMKDAKAQRFPTVTAATFTEAVMAVQNEAEKAYLLGGGVAAYIAPETTWGGKIERLMDLADAAPEEARARAFALSVIEQPLGEILSNRAAVVDILGEEVDLAESLAAMTRLAASKAVVSVVAFDPTLDSFFRLHEALTSRLSSWLLDPAFHTVRMSLLRRVLREIKGPRRLRPRSADEEIEVMRALALALAAASGDLIAPDEVQQAFIERSRGILGGDFVNAYLEGRDGALREAQALCRLAENVAGPLNKTTAARWLLGVVMSLRFEKEARGGADSPATRLVLLAGIQKSVQRAGLAEPDTETITSAIGVVGGMVEADSGLVSLLSRSQAATVQKLSLLLQLAVGDAAPRGPAADRAKAEALKLLRRPETRAALAAAPSKIERVRALVERAGLAA